MRAATCTNRALLAVVAFFVVCSALGESPEPTKIRITTWNLERPAALSILINQSASRVEQTADGIGLCQSVVQFHCRVRLLDVIPDASVA